MLSLCEEAWGGMGGKGQVVVGKLSVGCTMVVADDSWDEVEIAGTKWRV